MQRTVVSRSVYSILGRDSAHPGTWWTRWGQQRALEAETKRLEEVKLCRSVERSGRLIGKANLLFLDYLGSPPKSSLAMPCLMLAMPETLIFPAPSVWICSLTNLYNV